MMMSEMHYDHPVDCVHDGLTSDYKVVLTGHITQRQPDTACATTHRLNHLSLLKHDTIEKHQGYLGRENGCHYDAYLGVN